MDNNVPQMLSAPLDPQLWLQSHASCQQYLWSGLQPSSTELCSKTSLVLPPQQLMGKLPCHLNQMAQPAIAVAEIKIGIKYCVD